MGEHGDSLLRRGFAALACWYGVALLPAVVYLLIPDPPPQDYGVRMHSCPPDLPSTCADPTALDVQLLGAEAVLLLASLVIAVPFCIGLVRAWRRPVAGAAVAALAAWSATPLLGCAMVQLLSR